MELDILLDVGSYISYCQLMDEHLGRQPNGRLEDRLRSVATDLQGGLLPILWAVAGPSPRPARLTQRLGIDKSLASRVSRASRTEDPLEFMHFVPAPTGLRIILDAATKAKVDPILRKAAEQAVDRFQGLLDETPGGRSTLDAAISTWSQEARKRNERSAKHSVYRGMSYALGLDCEAMASAFIIQPSDDGSMVDAIDVQQRVGLRRLRSSAPMGIFSLRIQPSAEGHAPQIQTLSGEEPEDVFGLFLSEFSTDPLPKLDVLRSDTQTTVALADGGDGTVPPFSLTSGVVVRGVMQRHATEACRDEWRGYLLHYPCKTVIRDVYIRDDLYFGTVPEIALQIPTPGGLETKRHAQPFETLNTLDLSTPIEHLGAGLSRIGIKEIPTYSGLIPRVFEQTGWDPSRFRGYRTRLVYPLPMIFMTWWFHLPEKDPIH